MSPAPMKTSSQNRADDLHLPDLGQLSEDGVVISHRPGKRAVVRRETPQGIYFIKVVRPGRAAKIMGGIRRAEPFDGPFRMPNVVDNTDSTVTFDQLAGTSMHESELFAQQEWAQAWSEFGQALVDVLSAKPSDCELVHRAEAEVRVLRQWFERSERELPHAGRTAAALERISGQLLALPSERLAPTHRDLHDKQLVWSPELGPGLLDTDTVCLADPALDLGNLRAHAALRVRQGLWSTVQAETVRFCLDSAAEQARVPRESVAVYECAATLRLSMVYALRPPYTKVAAELGALVSL